MALIPLFPSDFFFSSIKTHPKQQFVSSSAGVTGDVFLFVERSKSIKNITPDLKEYHFDCLSAIDYDFATGIRGLRDEIADSKRNNISNILNEYIDNASNLSERANLDKKLITHRFDIPHRFNANSIRKSVFINNLLPYYRSHYDYPLDFGFTNYHTLNFFTSSAKFPSNVPSNSALVYPVPVSTELKPSRYYPSGSFTFEFYINPRYTTDTSSDDYTPGTILHMPNSYCISLLSGSGKDEFNRPSSFRLALQLKDQAQKKPSNIIDPPTVLASGSISERIFISEDNHLLLNNWSHCAIRWGGKSYDNSTGSFYINGRSAGNFVIDGENSLHNTFADTDDIPGCLVVGNWYESSNSSFNHTGGDLTPEGKAQKINFMFDGPAGKNFGTEIILSGATDSVEHNFTHPLNAELQEIKIFSRFRDNFELDSSMKTGYYNFDDESFLFYVPPYFIPSSSKRSMLKTVTQTIFSSSHTPFNIDLSFGQGARSLNLENFVLNLVDGNQPRCFNLEESVSPAGGDPADFDATDFDFIPATDAIYRLPQNRKRNLTILPSDLGAFRPNFDFLDNKVSKMTNKESEKYFVDDKGFLHSGQVNLLDLISIKETHEELSFLEDADSNPDSIAMSLLPDPQVSLFSFRNESGDIVTKTKDYSDVYGDQSSRIDLTILNRTKDTHSNEITFFDISNMFYGDLIKEESLRVHDPFVSGSAGKIKLTLKDNGNGSLYRCDSTGSHPVWASVGKVLYEEGLVSILDPTIPSFGKNSFDISFSGDKNIHVLEMRVPISSEEALSSSNPTFSSLKPTDLPSDEGLSCNFITNMNIHDENLNVIGKVNLSRPIVRKENDKYVFKFKLDY
tara:strand:+ start:416 stop:2965 length:2550 start_codon:yes stop_codon:yes gene_type:complete